MFGILATEKSSRWLLGKSIKFAVKLIYFPEKIFYNFKFIHCKVRFFKERA